MDSINIYLLTQSDNTGYDSCDSMIIQAKNEKEARIIHPSDQYKDNTWKAKYNDKDWNYKNWNYNAWWANKPENVKVKLIGKTIKSTKTKILLTSFNAL